MKKALLSNLILCAFEKNNKITEESISRILSDMAENVASNVICISF